METLEQRISIASKVLLTKEQLCATYAHTGHAAKAQKVVDKYGIFDENGNLTYLSRKLPFVSLLGLYVHFSGSLSALKSREDGSPFGYQAFIHHKNNERDLRPVWTKNLGLTFCSETDHSESTNLRLGMNGGIYARILYLLGFSTSLNPSLHKPSRKAQRDAQLPHYISSLVKQYSSLDNASRTIARTHLRDLVSVFLDTRSYLVSTCSLRVGLISQKQKEDLKEQAEVLLGALQCAYPDIDVSLKNNFNIVAENSARSNYAGYLTLQRDALWKISQKDHFFPIRFRIAVSPRFSHELSWNNHMTKVDDA
jgi:hypothetical protein